MVVGEKVFNLVKRHVVSVRRGAESSSDKVAGAVTGNYGLEFWEVLRVQLVVLHEVRCRFRVGIRAQHPHDFFFKYGLVVDHQFGGGDALVVDEVQNELEDIKLVKKPKLGYYDSCLGKLSIFYILLG